jgi:hypothetical protein
MIAGDVGRQAGGLRVLKVLIAEDDLMIADLAEEIGAIGREVCQRRKELGSHLRLFTFRRQSSQAERYGLTPEKARCIRRATNRNESCSIGLTLMVRIGNRSGQLPNCTPDGADWRRARRPRASAFH